MTRHFLAAIVLVLTCTGCSSTAAGQQEQMESHKACGISQKEWSLLSGPAPKQLLEPWSHADRARFRFFVSSSGNRWLACIPGDASSCGAVRFVYTKTQVPVAPFGSDKWREEWIPETDEEHFPAIVLCVH